MSVLPTADAYRWLFGTDLDMGDDLTEAEANGGRCRAGDLWALAATFERRLNLPNTPAQAWPKKA